MNKMLTYRDIRQILLMRRLIAYMLVLKYLNRLTTTVIPAEAGIQSSTEYSYDSIGRITYINDSISGPIEYVYNNNGCSTCGGAVDKVIQEITPLGSISYAYDAIGRRTAMTVAGQPDVNYTYDVNSRLTGIVIASGAWQSLSFGFTYDALGRRTSLTRPNGITTNYSYDNASHLLELKHLNPLNAVLEQINYVYDANGNRTKMDRQNVSVKLPNAVTNTSYNSANQMLTFNDKAIAYDNNGNMTSVTNSCGTTTYVWDARNRLTVINGFNSDCSPLTANFKYDALGRRIEKTINGKTIQYLYDGLDIIQEIENGVVSVNYIRTLNIDEPLARIKSDGTIRYYQQDALGSVIALTDETGTIMTQYVYDPYGNTTILGEQSDNPFQYTGRENDGTGLYYYRARYYSPELQRFISEDPIGLLGGINLYAYVDNNPVNFVDPMGLDRLRYHTNAISPYIEWLNDNGFVVATYSAFSGTRSGKLKPLPYGLYTGNNLRLRTKKGMRCGDSGWSLDLSPANFSTNRTLLRIHPDEPPFGTEGCIGISCNYAAGALYNQLFNYFNSGHSTIPVEVTY
ncbi:MAG: hypothetical protein HY755_02285 [Nitrospirae bacterium]|nr:hypothetical protein [Nitrospirota bacterium]